MVRDGKIQQPAIVPTAAAEIVPSEQSIQGEYRTTKSKYIKCKQIIDWAVEFWKKNKKGFTYRDLIDSGFARQKHNAQRKIRYACQIGMIFTIADKKPQVYYPSSLKGEIGEYMREAKIQQREEWVNKTVPVRVTGINDPVERPFDEQDQANASSLLQALRLLPNYPLCIHKIQLKLCIDKEYFEFPGLEEGFEKHYIIDRAKVSYRIYSNGTVMIFVKCSATPFKLQTEEDEIALFIFLGQIRERLAAIIHDMHSYIPPLTEWLLTQCDINRDMEITDIMQIMSIPAIQLKLAQRVFRIYVKSLDGLAKLRGEESLSFKDAPVIKTLRQIRNPNEEFQGQVLETLSQLRGEIARIASRNGWITSSWCY